MAKIKQIIYNEQINSSAQNIVLNVTGDQDALFSVSVVRSSDSKNYNFDSATFVATTTSQNRLENLSPGEINIEVPAASGGDTYTVTLIANVHLGTTFSDGTFVKNTVVTQLANTTITFTATGSGFTNTNVGQITGSAYNNFSVNSRLVVKMDKKQITVPSAFGDFGFFINSTTSDLNNGEWNSDAFYWETTEAIVTNPAGDGVSGNTVTVADLTSLVVGMTLVYHKGTTAPGSATEISSINTNTKTITFSTSVAFEDGETMTFRAFGPRLIRRAINIGINLKNSTVVLGQITTSVDDEITSNVTAGGDINVNGTTGIGVGATIRMRGLNKSSSASACTVSRVDSALSVNGGGITGGAIQIANGQLEASSDRPIRTKTKIYIDGSSNKVFLNGDIIVDRLSAANQVVYIDMSKITTQGTAT
jgi:hypothetical protein